MTPLLLMLATAFGATERFALIAGSNDGGDERARLRYADTDATDFASVLHDLGGLPEANTALLLDTDPEAIDAELQVLAERITAANAAGSRTELVFYYSGHSDAEGLLPRGARYDYATLRDRLGETGADVQLVVLDSCASGAAFRTKGGTVTAPFLVDTSTDVRGRAYLTSSTADEVAQESDRIGASFFTHYLVSGLRGAADATRDGLVTLHEAYQFAKDETLARTERSLSGPQHASWDLNLSGTGDLVMTALDGTTAALYVPEGLAGRLFVRDAHGDLVAELSKAPTRDVLLGLEPGDYVVLLVQGDRHSEASVHLEKGQTVELTALDFHDVAGESHRGRGDAPEEPELAMVPLSVGLIQPIQSSDVKAPVGIGVGFVAHQAGSVDGFQAALAGVVSTGPVRGGQGALGVALASGDVDGVQGALGVAATTGAVRGAQTALGVSIAGGDVDGLQGSLGVNLANGDVEGVQGALGLNLARGEVEGLQGGIGVNFASKVDGAQIGSVNVAKETRGAQIGFVNVGDQVDGLQLGVINVARDADESIALIPIDLAGYNHVVVTTNESDVLDLGLTFGGKHLFTQVHYGVRPQEDLPVRHTLLLGFGLHSGLAGPVFLDLDAAAGNWTEGLRLNESVLVRGKVALGLEIVPKVAVIAGPTVNTIPWNADGLTYRATGFEGNTVSPNRWGWVGLFAGVRLF